MDAPKPARVKDIAAQLGLSSMSVSVALRGMPGVSEATRKRVQACAKRLGYHPDPALSALADYRRRIRPAAAFAQLAFVTDYPVKNDRFWSYTNGFFDGAQKRGRQFGYEVVPYWLREGGCTRQQASSILFNRGVKGLLIAPLPIESGHLDLTWKYFSAVAIGTSLASPEIDYAAFDHHYAMQVVWRELRARGYSRIGFILLNQRSARARHAPLDAYLGEQHRLPDQERLPPLLPTEFSAQEFWQWFDTNKPDVIITDNTEHFPRILEERRLRVPQDIGVVCYCRFVTHDPTVSGIVQNLEEIGAAAVDRLHTNLLRSAYGLPLHSHGTLTHGHWYEGTTLRRRVKKRAVSTR